MKTAALALLLVNLVLFGWLYTHPQQKMDSVIRMPELPASVEPLVLLRERAKADEAMAETPPAQAQAQAEPVQESAAQQAIPERADIAVEATPATSDMPVPAQLPESGPGVPQPGAPAAEPATDEPPPPPAGRVCQTIGPFPDRARAEAFMGELAALGREPSVRAAQIEQPSGYWVYLPSMPRAEVERIIADLAAKGVKDYFIGRQNFISLGVFSDKRSAETRVNEIAALGYSPSLEPRFLTREVFWVDLEEDSSERLDDADWDGLLDSLPDLRRQSVACE